LPLVKSLVIDQIEKVMLSIFLHTQIFIRAQQAYIPADSPVVCNFSLAENLVLKCVKMSVVYYLGPRTWLVQVEWNYSLFVIFLTTCQAVIRPYIHIQQRYYNKKEQT
jgi:hypothetical protein